ncbi:sulfatase, partial [bacterium]|nr:sulfatase [bacterium]
MKKRNVVFVFGDQWRQQSMGYAGNPTVLTPNLDQLASKCVNFRFAFAGSPVCTPWRASFLTGQYPLTHGLFVNDVSLNPEAQSIAKSFKSGGYDTAYVGKWHVDGQGRTNFIPRERQQGFDYWKVLECTHDYNRSFYYEGDSDEQKLWEGYDAIAQTRDARDYIRDHSGDKPFFLVLSWGPPHNPYETAPEEYRALYRPENMELRPNVPEETADKAREWLAGYYAHCSALDACIGDLLETLKEKGIEEETLFVFTSDHGDMLGSQGLERKQKPFQESIRVPFLMHCPELFGRDGKMVDGLINAPDIMPTLLSLCGLPVPETVEGLDFSGYLRGGEDPCDGARVIACHHPFGEWSRKGWSGRSDHSAPGMIGREYRGLYTGRYTYARSLEGPWLLFDNEEDPFQVDNLVNRLEHADLQRKLDEWLERKLEEMNDRFLPGMDYIREWGYE